MQVAREAAASGRAFLGYVNRQKWKWLAGVAVAGMLVVASLGASVVLYLVVNQLLVPRIHSQTTLVFGPPGSSSPVRLANASMQTLLSGRMRYSLDLHLYWPEKEENMAGEKIVGVILETAKGDVLYALRRSTLLRYKSWMRLVIEKVFWALPLALGWVDEAQTTVVNLADAWYHDGSLSVARVELDSTAQIYAAKLTARASLTGLTYYWYHWRITVLILFISIAWSMQLVFLFFVALIVLARMGAFSSEAAAERAHRDHADGRGIVEDELTPRAEYVAIEAMMDEEANTEEDSLNLAKLVQEKKPVPQEIPAAATKTAAQNVQQTDAVRRKKN